VIEHPSEVAQLQERLSAQDEQIKQLSEEMARLRQMVAPQEPGDATNASAAMDEAPTAVEAVASKRTGRRGMLKAAAAGAAALGVAAVAVKGAPIAHAGSGDGATFQLGQGNDAPNVTYTVGTSGSTPGNLLGSYDVNQTGASATYGNSHSSYGIAGHSDTGVDIYSYGTGRLQLALSGFVGVPTSGTYSAGEMIRDDNGDMFICVSSGSPGFWLKVAAFDPFFAGGAVNLYNPPFRLYDSRSSGGPLLGSSFRDIFFGTAAGLVGNLTVTNTTGNGYLVIYPTGAPTPSTSTVNYLHGQTNANSFIVGVGATGYVRVHNFSSGNADFIIDATGFIGE